METMTEQDKCQFESRPTQRAATVLDVKAVVAFYSVGKEE
jgi:hypothetical protein